MVGETGLSWMLVSPCSLYPGRKGRERRTRGTGACWGDALKGAFLEPTLAGKASYFYFLLQGRDGHPGLPGPPGPPGPKVITQPVTSDDTTLRLGPRNPT